MAMLIKDHQEAMPRKLFYISTIQVSITEDYRVWNFNVKVVATNETGNFLILHR